MRVLQADQHLEDLTSFVRRDLPPLNTSCRDRAAAGLADWIRQVTPALGDIERTTEHLDDGRRFSLLQQLGLILSSGERHAQFAGRPPGWILHRLPGLERSLVIAAGDDRVPALTAELYWERNDGPRPLSFTGEEHELFFISAVRTHVALRSTVNAWIRGIHDGHWRPDSVEAARVMHLAAVTLAEAHGQYQDFHRGPEGGPLMTPAQFNEMRVWLAGTVVNGRRLPGANAAYIAEMAATDYLLGTADAEYDAYTRGFTPYLAPAGRCLLEQDRARVPLVLVLADALGLKESAFDGATSAEIAALIAGAPKTLKYTLLAFKELADEFVGASGTHIGLIHVYLKKYAETLSAQERERMPVNPAMGTGGHAHDATRRLHRMRQNAPRVKKLLRSIRESGTSEYQLAGSLWRRAR